MHVFISQSKPRSLELALALEGFIRKVIHGAKPWVSKSGTDKGSRWGQVVAGKLKEVAAGLVVVTPENKNEAWILFEAGALSVKTTDRVWTYLLDLGYEDLDVPLGEFQHTKADKDDTRELMKSIHKAVNAIEVHCSEADMLDMFEALWDKELGPTIERLKKQGAPLKVAKRDDREILAEVLETVRGLSAISSRSLELLESGGQVNRSPDDVIKQRAIRSEIRRKFRDWNLEMAMAELRAKDAPKDAPKDDERP